jgi:NAD(P)H dehydrogenase (quinone)
LDCRWRRPHRRRQARRAPETVPESIAKGAHFKLDQAAPIATPNELPNYDAIAVGAPTRFGRMPSAMGSFWERAGALWMSGALHGRVGDALTSSVISAWSLSVCHIVTPAKWTLDEIVGRAPYGATTIVGVQGQRQPTKLELDGARRQGELIAKAAAKMAA